MYHVFQEWNIVKLFNSKTKNERIREIQDDSKYQLIKDQPNWWEMQVSDWMPLVKRCLGRSKDLKEDDPEYKAFHDFMKKEQRRRKKEKVRTDEQAQENSNLNIHDDFQS